jgi:hypothetical protein
MVILKMGVEDFFSVFELIGEKGKGRKNSLNMLRGKLLGVDISMWFHKMCHSDEFAERFHLYPPVSMEYLVRKQLKILYLYFKHFNIDLVFVFDGARNPRKKITDDNRSRASKNTYTEFRRIIENEDTANISNIQSDKENKRINTTTPQLICSSV